MSARTLIILPILITSIFAQSFRHNLTGGYFDRGGNSDYEYYNFGWSTVANGDIAIGGLTLKDSEFLLAFDKNVSNWQGASYEDDQDLILKFDLWANGKVSPFLMFETSFNKLQGIKSRSNYGVGAKWRVFGDFLSISAAFLQESEEIVGKNSVYLYADFGDSLGVSGYGDNTDLKPTTYSRISIRPKLKLPLGDNFYYQSEYYYKPAGNDILTHWKNSFIIKTAAEWLSIEVKYNVKNDSRPAPKVFGTYDLKYYTEGQSITFENPGNAKDLLSFFDRNPEQSKEDGFGNYYLKDYESDDTTISIGINISF